MSRINNTFIDGEDLGPTTSLTHLLDRYDVDHDSEETHIIKHSPFYSEQQFIDVLVNSPGLNILDLNIRNIYSNFDELQSFINRVNILNPVSIICLNECWIKQNSDVSQINLPNYKMFCLKGTWTLWFNYLCSRAI